MSRESNGAEHERKQLLAELKAALLRRRLPKRDVDILMRRAGGETLASIGKRYKYTGQGIRSLLERTLEKAPAVAELFEDVRAKLCVPSRRDLRRWIEEEREDLQEYLENSPGPYNYLRVYFRLGIAPRVPEEQAKLLTGIDALEQMYRDFGVKRAMEYLRCRTCRQFKHSSEFSPHAYRMDGRHYCRKCHAKVYVKNAGKQREYYLRKKAERERGGVAEGQGLGKARAKGGPAG